MSPRRARRPEPVAAQPAHPAAGQTVVHVMRHGLVHNPTGVLYGRLPDFHLSADGVAMAEKVAATLAGRPISLLVSSPLERARETIAPLAQAYRLTPEVDPRLIEAGSVFDGQRVGVGDGVLRNPRWWPKLWNPFRPSWGEPYRELAVRMLAAVAAARDRLEPGHEAVLVSHQLPIWTLRSYVEHRRLWHDPRRRQCAVASLTSLYYEDGRLARLGYAEPAADLVARAAAKTPDVPAAGA